MFPNDDDAAMAWEEVFHYFLFTLDPLPQLYNLSSVPLGCVHHEDNAPMRIRLPIELNPALKVFAPREAGITLVNAGVFQGFKQDARSPLLIGRL
jgi:hypothetical protein